MPLTIKTKILGAAILCYSGKTFDGTTLETQQIVYITNNSDKTFLTWEACTALDIIATNFPTLGETDESANASMNIVHETVDDADILKNDGNDTSDSDNTAMNIEGEVHWTTWQQSGHQMWLPQTRTSTCDAYQISISCYGGRSYGSSTLPTRSVQIK